MARNLGVPSPNMAAMLSGKIKPRPTRKAAVSQPKLPAAMPPAMGQALLGGGGKLPL